MRLTSAALRNVNNLTACGILKREKFDADILIMIDAPTWKSIAKDISKYMKLSETPTFALWMDCPDIFPTRLVYSEGEYENGYFVTAEAILNPDIRPLYHFK